MEAQKAETQEITRDYTISVMHNLGLVTLSAIE